MKFPPRFNGVNVHSLPVKVVASSNGYLTEAIYENLALAKAAVNLSELVGPFADSYKGTLCIRFESKAACALLSE